MANSTTVGGKSRQRDGAMPSPLSPTRHGAVTDHFATQQEVGGVQVNERRRSPSFNKPSKFETQPAMAAIRLDR
jgi:hypothetical protein